MPLLCNRDSTDSFDSLSEGPLEAEAARRAAAGISEEWAFIVPNRIAQRRMEREFIQAARGRAISQLHILTLADLAGTLAGVAFPELAPIGDSESAVLIELAIRDLILKHQLDFFERAGSENDAHHAAFPVPRGTFELIVNTIRQLKESGIAPMDIERDLARLKAAKAETTEVRRATDILRIYQAYQESLRDRFMDTYGQVLLANERYGITALPTDSGEKRPLIEQDFRKAFPKVRDVFVSGFYYLEPPSIALIARLSEIEGLRTTIELEESKSNPDLFAGLMDLEERLLASGFQEIEEEPAGRRRYKPDALGEYLGQTLFRERDAPITAHDAPEIELFSAANAAGEVEAIARRIKLLYYSDPNIRANLSRIVVATPSAESYTPLFEEVFRRHEIPVEIADRYHLDRSPLVLALLALLELARAGLRKRDLLRVLSSPYFTFAHAGGEPLDAKNLLDVLAHYRPSGDAEALIRSLTAQLEQTVTRKAEAEDSLEFAREQAEEQRIRYAIRDIDRIATLLRPLARELTPADFCAAMRDLIAQLHISEQVLAMSAVTIATGTLELDARAYRAFTKLLEELESLFALMGIANETRPLAYFEQRLKAALMLRRYSSRPKSGAVLVTSLAQSISQTADYRFIAGLTEGAFPSAYQPQVFLTGSMQKGERKQLLEERVLFYQAITNFTSRLYLSYPKTSAGGAALNRSGFLDALAEVLNIETSPVPEGIFSYRDLYLATGRLEPAVKNEIERTHANAPWLRTLATQVPQGSKAVRARLRKEDSTFRGQVDPLLLDPEERAALEANQGRVWSVTQLERYANCPFHFFARDILALGETEDREEGLDARDRGSALHEILREFLLSRRERNLPAIQDIPEQELEAVTTDAIRTAERHFQTIASGHPFWRLDSERLLSEDQPGGNVFRRFIQREHELSPFELRPRFFEVSFGGQGRAPKTPIDPTLSRGEPVSMGGFKLRGKIDRIDVPKEWEDGTAAGDAFAIIDYKSGKETPSWSQIERGLSLQLPLYLRVAEDLLRSHIPELKGVAALYQKLLTDDAQRKLGLAIKSYSEVAFEKLKGRNGYVDSAEKLAEIIDTTIIKAKTYVDGVASGHFPLTEANLIKQCKTCPYGTVCRVREAEEAGVLG
ncbi:MAG TPA: PD-(D/E)XK nuclease family protein [Candidatus Kapabacteria bacterium]|nr:PD-(D/E)XK nuclease family protein [Candidatus Kapabacteria bacterium]